MTSNADRNVKITSILETEIPIPYNADSRYQGCDAGLAAPHRGCTRHFVRTPAELRLAIHALLVRAPLLTLIVIPASATTNRARCWVASAADAFSGSSRLLLSRERSTWWCAHTARGPRRCTRARPASGSDVSG